MEAHPLSIDSIFFMPTLCMLIFGTLAIAGGATVLSYMAPPPQPDRRR